MNPGLAESNRSGIARLLACLVFQARPITADDGTFDPDPQSVLVSGKPYLLSKFHSSLLSSHYQRVELPIGQVGAVLLSLPAWWCLGHGLCKLLGLHLRLPDLGCVVCLQAVLAISDKAVVKTVRQLCSERL